MCTVTSGSVRVLAATRPGRGPWVRPWFGVVVTTQGTSVCSSQSRMCLARATVPRVWLQVFFRNPLPYFMARPHIDIMVSGDCQKRDDTVPQDRFPPIGSNIGEPVRLWGGGRSRLNASATERLWAVLQYQQYYNSGAGSLCPFDPVSVRHFFVRNSFGPYASVVAALHADTCAAGVLYLRARPIVTRAITNWLAWLVNL